LGGALVIYNMLRKDLEMFTSAWDPTIKLVDFSLLVFVNKTESPNKTVQPSKSHCMPFSRTNPKTGEKGEELEMCFAIIDFFADLNLRKRTQSDFSKVTETFVFGKGDQCHGDKFSKDYAIDLTNLAYKMIFPTTAIREGQAKLSCLDTHYIPQAQKKHEKKAEDFIRQKMAAKEFTDHDNVIASEYYKDYPNGIPKKSFENKLLNEGSSRKNGSKWWTPMRMRRP